jgi:hypothetical protein
VSLSRSCARPRRSTLLATVPVSACMSGWLIYASGAWSVIAGGAEAALSEGLRPVHARAPARDDRRPQAQPTCSAQTKCSKQPIRVLLRLHLLAGGVQRVAEKDARQHIRVARRYLARHAASLHAWSSASAQRYAVRLHGRPVILSNRKRHPSFVLTCHQPAPWSDPPVSSADISAHGRAPAAPDRPPRACPGMSASGSARS